MRVRRSCLVGALVLAAMVLAGCGASDYKLDVRFPADTALKAGATVYLDGAKVGTIRELHATEGREVVATVVVKDVARAGAEIRSGIQAVARRDGGIDLDTSEIEPNAAPLRSGSTIKGRSRPSSLVTSSPVTLIVIVGGVALVLLVVFARIFFKLSVALALLALSAAAATVVHPLVVPWVESAYAAVDSAAPADGEAQENAEATDQDPEETTVEHVSRPSPKLMAFLSTTLVTFVVIQLLVGLAFRVVARKK